MKPTLKETDHILSYSFVGVDDYIVLSDDGNDFGAGDFTISTCLREPIFHGENNNETDT